VQDLINCFIYRTLLLNFFQVNYDNHALFRGDKRQKGSPVRIFTNLPAKDILLPATQGYW